MALLLTKELLVASQRLRRKWWTLITEVSRFSSWLLYMNNIVNIAIVLLIIVNIVSI